MKKKIRVLIKIENPTNILDVHSREVWLRLFFYYSNEYHCVSSWSHELVRSGHIQTHKISQETFIDCEQTQHIKLHEQIHSQNLYMFLHSSSCTPTKRPIVNGQTQNAHVVSVQDSMTEANTLPRSNKLSSQTADLHVVKSDFE